MATADRMERDIQRQREQRNEPNSRNPWPDIDEYLKATGTTNLVPNQDFRTDDPVEFREQDITDTRREIKGAQRRMATGEYEGIAASNAFATTNVPVSTFVPTSQSSLYEAKLELLEREQNSLGKPVYGRSRLSLGDTDHSNQVMLAAALARKHGAPIAAKDVENLINWERVNLAADRIVKLNLADKPIAADNVARTFAADFFTGDPEVDVELAALFQAAVQIKVEDDGIAKQLMDAAVDPTIINTFAESVGARLVPILQKYLDNVTNPIQQTVRAVALTGREVFGTDDLAVGDGSIVGNRPLVTETKYNETYLEDLVAKTDFTAYEVDIARTLHQSYVRRDGSGEEVIRDLYEKYGDDVESRIILSNIVESASGDPRYSQLMAQVVSAWMGNTGRFLNPFGPSPATSEYAEINDSKLLAQSSAVLGFLSEIIIDPLILGTPPLRAITATRYALAKLAPGAKGGVGSLALKSRAWHPTNKTQRAFQALVDDLNRVGDLRASGDTAGVAEARRRLARQHGVYWSDEIIEAVAREAPRTDGRLTVEGLVEFADNMNDDYLDTVQHYLNEADAAGVTAAEIPQILELVLDDLGVESFDQAIARTNKASFRASRRPQAPKRTLLADLRAKVANAVGVRFLPVSKQAQILAKYADTSDPIQFSKDLAENGIALGDDVRVYKSEGLGGDAAAVTDSSVAAQADELTRNLIPFSGTNVGRPSAVWDNLGRAASRIDTNRKFNLNNVNDAGAMYNYARQFLPRHMAAQIRNAWAQGNVGSRRLLMIGLVQAAGRSRGLPITRLESTNIVDGLAGAAGKGRAGKDAYGIEISGGEGLPSAKLFVADQERAAREAAARAAATRQPTPEDDTLPVGQPLSRSKDEQAQIDEAFDTVTVTVKPPTRSDAEDDAIRDVGGEEVLMDASHPQHEAAWEEMTRAVEAWRAVMLMDDDQVEKILDHYFGVLDDSVDDSYLTWYDQPTLVGDVYTIEPSLPSEMTAGLSRTADQKFIADGTISQADLRRMIDYWGVEYVHAWLYTGLGDNYLVENAMGLWGVSPAPRVNMAGDLLPGNAAIPTEYIEGLGVLTASRGGRRVKTVDKEQINIDDMTPEEIEAAWKQHRKKPSRKSQYLRIQVPWAKGGRKGRKEQAVDDRDEWIYEQRKIARQQLKDGELDDAIDDYLSTVVLGSRQELVPKTPALKPTDPPKPSDDVARNLGDSVNPETGARVPSALHFDQTADQIVVPTISDFETYRNDIGGYIGLLHRGGYGLQRATDGWSWGTLAGYRFGQRNAIEENLFFFLTGGRPFDWVSGRQVTTTLGRLKPDVYVTKGRGSKKGETQFIYKQNVGFINRWLESSRTFGWQVVKGDGRNLPDVIDDWADLNGLGGQILRHVIAPAMVPRVGIRGRGPAKGKVRQEDFISNEEWRTAINFLVDGDSEPFYELFLRALVAQKIGPVPLTIQEKKLIARVATGDAERALLEGVTGAGRFMNSSDLPGYMDEMIGVAEELPPGVGYAGSKPPPVRGSAIGVDRGYTTATEVTARLNEHWHHQLNWVMNGDGPVGELSVQLLHLVYRGEMTVVEAKQQIRTLIASMDENDAWSQRFSNLQRPEDVDRFSSDYFESVLSLFQRKDGSINAELLQKFFSPEGKYLGWYRPAQKQLDGEGIILKDRVTASDLARIPNDDLPPALLVPEQVDPLIPVATDTGGLINHSWRWMNRQNARLSKGPIFWANVLRIHRNTAKQRATLADEIESRSPGVNREAIDEAVEVLSTQTITEQAYEASFAYLDNPAVRTNVAWKSRNVSRYYRATEDFWRRIRRLAVQNPEAIAKGALIYGIAQDNGFVFKDQFGADYFALPGNQVLLRTLSVLMSQDLGMWNEDMPYSITGKALASSPSLDFENNLVPGLTGISAGFTSIVFELGDLGDKFPGIRQLALGPYYEPTGQWFIDAVNAGLPAHAKTLSNLLNQEERESAQVTMYLQTLAWMHSRGELDTLTVRNPDGSVTEREFTSYEDLKGTEQEQYANALTIAGLRAKDVMRVFSAPPPQLRVDDTSQFGKQLGIENLAAYENIHREAVMGLSDEFLKTVAESRGDTYLSPQDYAMDNWMGFLLDDLKDSPYVTGSYNLSPYRVSTFSTVGGPTSEAAMVQPSVAAMEWSREPENKKWLDNDAYRGAYSFFTPRSDRIEFSSAMWKQMRFIDRIKVKKEEELYIDQLARSEYDYLIGREIQRDTEYRQNLNELDPGYFDQLKFADKRTELEKDNLEREYGSMATKNMTMRQGSAQESYEAMNRLLVELDKESNDGTYGDRPVAQRIAFVNQQWELWDARRLANPGTTNKDERERAKAERDFWANVKAYNNPQNPEVRHYIGAVIARLKMTKLDSVEGAA
jgi:hypothetical protein